MSDPIIHLSSARASLVLLDGEIPRIAHWGAPLAADTPLDVLADLTARPVAVSAPDVPLVAPLVPAAGDGWRLRPSVEGCRVGGEAVPLRLRRKDTQQSGDVVTVSMADDLAGLELTVRLELDPHGVLTTAATITNTGDLPYAVSRLTVHLPVPMRASELLDLTGRWCRERHPQRVSLGLGSWVRETRHGRTGHDAPTLTHVGVPGMSFGRGEVWALHLAWSGDGIVSVERDASGFATLSAAELLQPGEVTLAAGESYSSPQLYAAYSSEGLDGIAAAYHDHVRARPQHPRRPRPVTLNTWEAVYFDHDLERLSALADLAASAGVERFVLDDGWFGSRRNDLTGLGDWTVSDDVWPDGLRPLIEHVRSTGMEFGIWVEPEMVNLDSDLARAHPDWLLSHPDRLPLPWRHQHVLDLAREEVFEHILGRLDALLRDHEIAYVKWDHNRDLVESVHEGRAGVRAQTLAAYRLIDELKARHPEVEIESCASGGGRVDLEILRRTDRVWTSDTIDPIERATIQLWTQSLLPPELVGAHIGSEVAHTTGRASTLNVRASVALFGHFGIEAHLGAMSAIDQRRVADAVAAHKEWRRLLHAGRMVRLDEVEEGAIAHGVVAHDRSEAVFSYTQLTSMAVEVPRRLVLRGLDPDRDYRLGELHLGGGAGGPALRPPTWRNVGWSGAVRGSVLMGVGIQLPVIYPGAGLVLTLTS